MGWQDAPIVSGGASNWQSAPIVGGSAQAPNRSFGQAVGEGLSALGGDIKDVAGGVINFLKTPGDVFQGKYGNAGDPRMEPAARSFALGMGGGELPLVKSASEAVGSGVTNAASKAGTTIGRVLPGATKKAESTISALGPSLDKDKIGQDVLAKLRPDYDALHAYRAKQLQTVANEMEEGPEKTAAFRKIYQHPRFDELRKFEESPLGQKAVATTTKYSSVPKINPKAFLKQAFNSPQDVRDLKGLFNGDQASVEQVAKQYVASDLKSVMENAKTASATEANPFKSEAGSVATALQRWRLKNQDWLKEVPETKRTVDTFVDNMTDLAKTQKHFKYAVSAGATLGLIEGGEHPFSWISRLFGGVE